MYGYLSQNLRSIDYFDLLFLYNRTEMTYKAGGMKIDSIKKLNS